MEGLCHWGAFEPATLTAVHEGFYRVRFRSGGSRWATAHELAAEAAACGGAWHEGAAVEALRGEWVRALLGEREGSECGVRLRLEGRDVHARVGCTRTLQAHPPRGALPRGAHVVVCAATTPVEGEAP
ncbi:hypothetical protein AB1Y20_002693 [Prymnesium parvum]|uniref:Uncharacterized protein n=1 Tax=Prymnesium parvum TaxID=97485 RepID=A0AB34JBJ6_PRYPA